MSGARLYIGASSGSSKENVRRGLRWLVGHAPPLTIFLPSLSQVTDSLFAELIGEPAAKRAKKDRVVSIAGHTAKIITAQTMSRATIRGAVVALWPTDEMIAAIDEVLDGDLLALAWGPEGTGWKKKWGFIELGDNAEPQLPERTLLVAALESLARCVPAKNLLHSSDKASFVELLYLLAAEGEDIDPIIVERTLTRLRWPVEDAAGAGALARRFLEGPKPRRSKGQHWAPDIVDQWRAAIAKSDEA
jgi:hypothetical protein